VSPQEKAEFLAAGVDVRKVKSLITHCGLLSPFLMETPMFVARILFFGADKGGRYSPPQTGCRPQINIHGIHTSCVIEGLDGEVAFSFDREHRVSLKLMFPDQYPDELKVGDAVNLYEGNKLIGTGRVIEAR